MTINGYTIKPIIKGYQLLDKNDMPLHYFKTFVEALNEVINILASTTVTK